LCTNENVYLPLVKSKDISFDNFKITKNWKIRDEMINMKDLYVQNVLNYQKAKLDDSQKYIQQDRTKALVFVNSTNNQRINIDNSILNDRN